MAKAVAKKPVKKRPAKQLPKQLEAYQFKPGQSGNPKGRAPKGQTLAEMVREVLYEQTGEEDRRPKFRMLVDVLVDRGREGDIPAIKLLFERGFGTALPEAMTEDRGTSTEALVVKFVREQLTIKQQAMALEWVEQHRNGNGSS